MSGKPCSYNCGHVTRTTNPVCSYCRHELRPHAKPCKCGCGKKTRRPSGYYENHEPKQLELFA